MSLPAPQLPPAATLTAPLPGRGGRSLCPLVMAGDPSLEATAEILEACIAAGVRVVELCLPFPDPFTDGPVLRRAHGRALAAGAAFEPVLELIARYAERIAIVLLADVSHSLRPQGFATACRNARDAGAAAMLPHGLPPRMRGTMTEAAAEAGLPLIGTLYAGAAEDTRRRVLGSAGGFLYLVSAYGRSGGKIAVPADLAGEIAALALETPIPVALGFGLKTPEDVATAFDQGADIAIVGSATSAAVEAGIAEADPAAALSRFLHPFSPVAAPASLPTPTGRPSLDILP